MQIKRLIEERTETALKVKNKTEELSNVRKRLGDINNMGLFEITYDDYKHRNTLIDYYSTQHNQLTEFINNMHYDPRGTLEEQIINGIRPKVSNDEEVSKAFSAFEQNPDNEKAQEEYNLAFNSKLAKVYQEVLDYLEPYFEVVGAKDERVIKFKIEQSLPKPRTGVDIATKKESSDHGIPFSYK